MDGKFDVYLYQEISNPICSWLIEQHFHHIRWILGNTRVSAVKLLRQAADEQDPDLDRLLEALLEVGGPYQSWLKTKKATFFLNFRGNPTWWEFPRGHKCPKLIPESPIKATKFGWEEPTWSLGVTFRASILKIWPRWMPFKQKGSSYVRGHIFIHKGKKPTGDFFLEEHLWLGLFGIHREILHTTPT